MRRRRNAIVLAVSFAAHAALVIAWMSTRADLAPGESPTLEVQLVRLPPRRPPLAHQVPPKARSQPRAPDVRQPVPLEAPPPPPSAPSAISPEWRVKPEAPSAADLAAAPFAGGRPRPRGQAMRPSCKSLSWDRPIDCPPDDAEIAASKSDAAKDSKTSGFEAEGAHKRAMKTYHELPGDLGYPGIKCAILHRC